MSNRGLQCLLLLVCVLAPAHAAEKSKNAGNVKVDVNQILQTVAREQSVDPVIGIWSAAAGGYSWRTAIIKNHNAASDGFEFEGVLVQALAGFKIGETHLLMNRTAAPGEYSGKEKWKGGLLFPTRWETASLVFIDDYHMLQTNNISFNSAIGTEWRLVRELPPALMRETADAPPAPTAPAVSPTRERGQQVLAPIAPPPSPVDMPPPQPKTISLGQTRDEVVATLGQPQKVVKLAAKEMLYYPEMKVILVEGKVADVE